MPTRRQLLASYSSLCVTTMAAGCLFEINLEDESETPTPSHTRSPTPTSTPSPTPRLTQTPTPEVRDCDPSEVVLDAFEITAGDSETWTVDAYRGDHLVLQAMEIESTRPSVEILDPDGDVHVEIDRESEINEVIEIQTRGDYEIILENRAILTTGKMGIRVEHRCDSNGEFIDLRDALGEEGRPSIDYRYRELKDDEEYHPTVDEVYLEEDVLIVEYVPISRNFSECIAEINAIVNVYEQIDQEGYETEELQLFVYESGFFSKELITIWYIDNEWLHRDDTVDRAFDTFGCVHL